MEPKKLKPLTESEEKLIHSFYDGACSRISSWRAKKLLRNNEAARHYFDSIKLTSQAVKSWSVTHERKDLDLWDRVSARIEQEEHAAVFLGERHFAADKNAFSQQKMNLFVGISGAVVAASVAFVIFSPFSRQGQNSSGSAGDKNVDANRVASEDFVNLKQAPAVKFVSSNLNEAAPVSTLAGVEKARKINEAFKRSPVELEWIKSDGRVRLLQHPKRNSTIIWVNQKGPGFQNNIERHGSKVINRNIPQAIPVKDKGVR